MDEEQEYIESCKAKLKDLICKIEAGDRTTKNYYEVFEFYNILNTNVNNKYLSETEKYIQLAIQSAWSDIEKNNNVPEAYKILSLISDYQKDKDKMFMYINKAIELEPNNADYYLTRGRFYDVNNQKSEAEIDFDKACKLDPQKIKHVKLYKNIDKNTWNIRKVKIIWYLLVVLMMVSLATRIYDLFK